MDPFAPNHKLRVQKYSSNFPYFILRNYRQIFRAKVNSVLVTPAKCVIMSSYSQMDEMFAPSVITLSQIVHFTAIISVINSAYFLPEKNPEWRNYFSCL